MSVVVVATNGSDACRRAVARTAELFARATLVVATVVPGGHTGAASQRHVPSGAARSGGSAGVRAIADDLALDAARLLLAEACLALGEHARPVLLTGDPVEALAGAVRSSGADTLVVGSLGRGPVAGVLGTSVGTELVREVPCSVIELG